MARASRAIAPAPEEARDEPVRLGRLDAFLGFRLRRIQNMLSRQFAAATAEHNLRSGLFSSLAMIDANPGIAQNMLAREVGLDKSVMVMIVDDLERRGWAARERSAVDRRRHALTLTEEGRAALDGFLATLTETELAANASLSPGELALLHELLDRIYETCAPAAG